MHNLNHIEIQREKTVRTYKFPPNPKAPKPPKRDREEHANKLKTQLKQSIKENQEVRQKIGVEGDKLLIVRISESALSPKYLEKFLAAFNISLIEEVKEKDGLVRLLIQFPDENAIKLFNEERELWRQDVVEDNILTYAQRRDIFSCIEDITRVSPEDKVGIRLKEYLARGIDENKEIIVDIDIWYDGSSSCLSTELLIKRALGNIGGIILGDFFKTPSLLLGRVKVTKYGLSALLQLDVIANVELPIGSVSEELSKLLIDDIKISVNSNLEDDAPMATILDSGIFAGHPWLSGIIVDEEDFDQQEQTTNDLNGHGTAVAGIVAYGEFNQDCILRGTKPQVRICSAKVMHNEAIAGQSYPVFRSDKRPEQVVEEAIRFFYKHYNCRVFNLSAGDLQHIYDGGRQLAWAEVLDNLVKELDIIIIVSAGNVGLPSIGEFKNREELHKNVRNNLFNQEHRLIDPATAALCITVGSITRNDEPEVIERRPLRIAAGPKDSPSAFTRIGKGVNGSIKPEVFEYGGNYAVNQLAGRSRWITLDRNLGEITLNNTNEKLFRCVCGTSFAAPRITNLAARIERILEKQLEEKPSGNLIRALTINSATISNNMKQWAEQSIDPLYIGVKNEKQDRKHRLLGYGKCNDKVLYSGTNQVSLFAEDKLELRTYHLYKIPVPKEFLAVKSDKKIVISLAYNPPTRLSRKEYLANNVWFEVYRRIDEELLAKYKSSVKDDATEELMEELKKFSTKFYPGYPEVKNSTLQQRVWSKSKSGGADLDWDIDEPYIWILVVGKEKFVYPEKDLPQDYAIVITFSYDKDEDIKLYDKIKQNVRIKQREKVKQPVRVRIKR